MTMNTKVTIPAGVWGVFDFAGLRALAVSDIVLEFEAGAELTAEKFVQAGRADLLKYLTVEHIDGSRTGFNILGFPVWQPAESVAAAEPEKPEPQAEVEVKSKRPAKRTALQRKQK